MRFLSLVLALSLTACAGSSLPSLSAPLREASAEVKETAQSTLGAVQAACVVFPLVQDGVQVPAPVQALMGRCADVEQHLQRVIDGASTGVKLADLAFDLEVALAKASDLVHEIEAFSAKQR